MSDDIGIEQRETEDPAQPIIENKSPIPEIKIPGGKIGYDNFLPNSEAEQASKRWKDELNGDIWGFPELNDPDFVEGFIAKIPDLEEQRKYVENSAKFTLHSSEAYDPNYVLVFRRTLPSEEPKPEQHWSYEYNTARRGLKREIPQEHRLYTVILCSTLADVLSDTGYSQESKRGESDGEIKVDTSTYDQKRGLLSFRPKDQQIELENYQKLHNALNLETVLQKVREEKGTK